MMKLTKIATSIALLASTISAPAMAQIEGLSANVAATSNYLWRGLEQSSGDAAISGGIDYEADSGLYLGTWASNASWDTDMSYELDLYGGYVFELSEGVDLDVGFIYFAYPDALNDELDFSEVYAHVSVGDFSFGIDVLVDAEGYDAGDSTYASVSYATEISEGLELAINAGMYSGDLVEDGYGDDLIDVGISLSKDGFSFGLYKSDYDGDDDVKAVVSYSMDIDL
ncbi:hypothetical protein HR060_09740 [Catenovulum sp. SM1970]|uniref:TorF family putative porin n=1 Tax=Marinifaba aquimaris TaxID=2741323 RepID=UPI00157169F0|nr:TorF family putative porin [Marinifaba aquimaris]NTS77144.1 hypothetical protein [Marinifaba aquimaris]